MIVVEPVSKNTDTYDNSDITTLGELLSGGGNEDRVYRFSDGLSINHKNI